MTWQYFHVFNLQPQNPREDSLKKHSRSHRLFPQLYTHNIMLFLSKYHKIVQDLAEADAPLIISNSHSAPLTYNLENK